jgi:hypothetical protein
LSQLFQYQKVSKLPRLAKRGRHYLGLSLSLGICQKQPPSLGKLHQKYIKMSKKDDNYGKPVAGTKSEARGKIAHQNISNEILELCAVIEDNGVKVAINAEGLKCRFYTDNGPCHVSGIFLPLRVKSLPLATIYEVKIPLRKWKKSLLQRNPAQMTSAIGKIISKMIEDQIKIIVSKLIEDQTFKNKTERSSSH